jgi:glucose/arabinose dehydrogenase
MKTWFKMSMAVLALAALNAAVAFAGGFDWKQKVTYGNSELTDEPSEHRAITTEQPQQELQMQQQREQQQTEQQQTEQRRAFSVEPGMTEPEATMPFKPGDRVIVRAEESRLMIGDRDVGAVHQGERLTVTSVEGNWIGFSFQRDGKEMRGWLRAEDLEACPAEETR